MEQKDNDPSPSKLTSFNQERDEVEYLEADLNRIAELASVPLLTRRESITKEDPMEELMDVHQDVIELE